MKKLKKIIILFALIASTCATAQVAKDSQHGRIVGKDTLKHSVRLYLDFDNNPKTVEGIATISTTCSRNEMACLELEEGDNVSVAALRQLGENHKDGHFFGIGYCPASHWVGVRLADPSIWDKYKDLSPMVKVIDKKVLSDGSVDLYLSSKDNSKKIAYKANINTACHDALLALFYIRKGDYVSLEYISAIGYGDGHGFFARKTCPYYHNFFIRKLDSKSHDW